MIGKVVYLGDDPRNLIIFEPEVLCALFEFIREHAGELSGLGQEVDKLIKR